MLVGKHISNIIFIQYKTNYKAQLNVVMKFKMMSFNYIK